MKLRLPLALKAILLACMFNSSVTYATSTPPEGQEGTTLSEGSGNIFVKWAPAPQTSLQEDEQTANAVQDDDDEAEEGDTPALAVEDGQENTVEGILLSFADAFMQLPGITSAADPTTVHVSGGYLPSSSGSYTTSYRDENGKLHLTFHVGKFEEFTVCVDGTDTRAYWDRPETYNPAFFPQHWQHNGYIAAWVHSGPRIPAYYLATTTATSTATATGAGSYAPAPAIGGGGFGGFGGGGAASRPAAPAKPVVSTDDDKPAADDEEDTDKKDELTGSLTEGLAETEAGDTAAESPALAYAMSISLSQVGETFQALPLPDTSVSGQQPLLSGAAAAIVDATAGTLEVSSITIANTSGLKQGTYNLIQTSTANAEDLATRFEAPSGTSYREFTFENTDGMLQLHIENITQTITSNTAWRFQDQLPVDVSVVIQSGTLNIGNGCAESSTFNGTIAGGGGINYGDITVKNGATLKIQDSTISVLTVLQTDKIMLNSHITLEDGSKITVQDGSHYFKGGLTVAGNATIETNWQRGNVYGAINGTDAENEGEMTLTFIMTAGHGVNLTTFGAEGDFRGKVVLSHNKNVEYYVLDHGLAFKNALLHLNAKAQLGLNQAEVTLRGLSGAAGSKLSLATDETAFAVDNNTKPATIKTDQALAASVVSITGNNDASTAFSGTIGAGVTLKVESGAAQTLNNATVNGSLNNAGELTLLGMGGLDFTKLTNTGALHLGGGGTTLGENAAGLGGTIDVLAGGQVTITDSLGSTTLTGNAGTLTINKGVTVTTADDFTNTGTLNTAITQSLRGEQSGTMNVLDGGDLTITGTLNGSVAVNAGGTFTMDGVSLTTNNHLDVKGGEFNLSSGAVRLSSTDKWVNVNGGGEFNVTGGSLTASYLLLHDLDNSDSSDTFNLSGGVVNITSTNNAYNQAAVVIGQRQGGTGTLNVTGGVLNVVPGRIMLGYDGTGNMSLTGGEVNAQTLDVRGSLTLGGDGRLNLGTGGVVRGGGTGNDITISGGTLGTLATNNVDFTQAATLDVEEGTFTVDTQQRQASATGASTQTQNAGQITISGALSGAGDIEKTGKGKLILSGDNTATGTLIIREGELEIQGDGANGWTAAKVSAGATMTLAASCTRTNVEGITNNGTLQIGTNSILAANQQIAGNGVVVVQGGGTLVSNNAEGMANASRITVAANGTLDFSNGYTQTLFQDGTAQRLVNNGNLIFSGDVKLQSLTSSLIANAGVITIREGTHFNMDAWADMLEAPENGLEKAITMFTGMGSVTGNDALSVRDFYLGGNSLIASDLIRSISMNNQGVLTIQYWSTQNTDTYDTSQTLGSIVLSDNNPKTVNVAKGQTVVVDALMSTYTEKFGTINFVPGNYSLTKRGEGTLQILSVPTGQIDNLTVVNGKVVFGEAPTAYTTQQVEAVCVHYDKLTSEGNVQAGLPFYVYDSALDLYKPASDETLAAAGLKLYTYSDGNYTLYTGGAAQEGVTYYVSDGEDYALATADQLAAREAARNTIFTRSFKDTVYDALAGDPEEGVTYYVYDAQTGAYTTATEEQIAAGTGLYTQRAYTVDKITPTGDSGKKVVFDIGSSRLTSMGGSVENIIYDYETHRITSVNPDKPALMTDVELRLGNIINNDTSLVNVQFAGTSGLSGFITVDQAGDNDMGANISVNAGSTLTIGTATNNKLAFNFMPGTIRDHNLIGNADVWDHHLIDLGQDSNLVNWDNDHVAFYYNGILTKGIISIGEQTDSNDHLGVAHIDITKAPELLWNGTAGAWNPTNTLSTGWYEGTNLSYDAHGILQHSWDYSHTSRFYALSNVHFNTLEGGGNSDIRLGQDLTVLNFSIGVAVNDSLFGDTNWDGTIDGLQLDDIKIDNDARRTVYNKTAYTFSSGNLRILRNMYVRTAADLTFEGSFNIDAQAIYLYNKNENARVTFGGKITANNLTIGQTGVSYDCYGIYTFNSAVELAQNLYIHVDSTSAIPADVDQALFNSTLKVGGDVMLSGFGSKGFKGRVDIGGDLTVSSCMQLKDTTQTVATSSQAAFSDVLTVEGDLILKNGGNAILFKQGSQIKGEVVMDKGTLTLVDGMNGTFGNGGRAWTIRLIGDEGHLSLSPNTYAHITKLYSGDGLLHDFTIEGNSRNTDIFSMVDVKDLIINGGKITFRENTSGKTNTGGIHGDFYVGSTAAIFLNGNNIFTTDTSSHERDNGHTITVDGGVVTLNAGTTQTMTDKSKLVLNSAIVLAPVTNNQTKGSFTAHGDMDVEFTGTTNFGASIAVNAGANTLTFHDVQEGVTDSIISVGGAISAAENARIVIAGGTHVQLDGLQASMSGNVSVQATEDDLKAFDPEYPAITVNSERNFLNSALTVTQGKQTVVQNGQTVTKPGQIDNARITVAGGASLDVVANTPVDVQTLTLDTRASLVLANVTGTKDLDASLSCIRVTDTASIANPFNIYFKDDLKTMQTYALLSLTKEGDDQKLTAANYQDLVDIYVRNWDTNHENFEVGLLDKDQYELKLSTDGKTLYLATFFGMIWDGGLKAGDSNADGLWKPTDTAKNWTNKNWTEGQTAIFRDLAGTENSTVHVQDTIHVDGIYVTSETTNYTFIGEETTLRNLVDDDPDITKNGAAVFTMQDFGNERLGKIDINRGVMQIMGSTIDFTEELVVADEGTLKIFSGSSLSERVYQKDANGKYVLTDGHKALEASAVGKLSALGANATDFASFSNLKADEGLLAGASSTSVGRVSGAVVEGYTIKNVTFADANKLVDTTIGSGVSVAADGTLTLAGTTTFTDAITMGAGAGLALDTGAVVDIGALEYTKNVEFGNGDADRLHTYHLFTAGNTGAGITDPTGETHNLFSDANVMINGALLTKYSNEVLNVHGYDAANGTITLELKGVETPHWDAAWGIDQKKSPWLGHLILDGTGKLTNGNYMDYDSNATSLEAGVYRYNQLLSEGTTSQVNPNATSIVVSFRIDDAEGKVFASGYQQIEENHDITPAGEIWVYDTGSAFSTKVAGYVNGDTINLSNGDFDDLADWGRLEANDLVTHMVLTDTTNDPDHRVHTARAVGGSVYVNSRGSSHTYISVMDSRVTVDELIGGNVWGNLNGDTNVYVHSGHVGNIIGGGRKGSVHNINITVDGGSVDAIHGSSWESDVTGDVHVQLLGGTVGKFTTSKTDSLTENGWLQGDLVVDYTSDVKGTTLLQGKVRTDAFNSGKRATLNLINNLGVDDLGNQRVFSLMGTRVEGFDIINIGENGLVEFNVLGNFMTASTNNRKITLEGTGRVLLSNSNDSNGNNGTGQYWLTVTKGITLQLNNSFIHSQNQPGSYPTIEIQDGATFDFSSVPVQDGGGIGARLVISGHGVDGLGAMYKAGDVGMKANLTALPFIDVKANASIGGTESFCSDHNKYNYPGYVDMADGGLNHTLTKQGSSTWMLQRITVKGGTLNIVDTSTIQLTQNSSGSPWKTTPAGNDLLGTREASSSTDIVVGASATLLVDDGAYKHADSGQTYQINSFSARSLSGNGKLVLNNSHMYLYTEAANTEFYSEYLDPTQKFWNSEGYTYAVFGGTISDMDTAGGNMLIKAGDGRQFLSGSASTYDGTTRMDDGILYLLGTSYGSMVKGTSTVSEGVLGTSHLEWNGGTVTLGNNVRIYNNGQSLSGAVASGGVSEMLIRVNGLTSTSNASTLTVGAETYTSGGVTYHKVDISEGVETVLCHGIYGDGTRYYSGDKVDPNKTLYVLKDAGATVPVNSTYLMVLEDTYTAPDGTVYHKVDTTGIKSLSVDGVFTDGTTYTAGSTLTEAQQKKDLYVLKAENSMVFVTLDKARFDDATYSGVLADAQPVNGEANKGRLVKVGLGTLTIDQYNSYTGGTDVRAGTLNVQGWGLLGGTNSKDVDQTAGASLMLSYDGSYGEDECFFINTDMNLVGRGDVRWSLETGYTAALISNVGKDFNGNTTFTLAGQLKDAGNLLHMGAGTLYIDGWSQNAETGVYMHNGNALGNTYTGGTTVTNGRVFVRKDAGLGATADGEEANLITLPGTEVHFEDCTVTLAAVQTMARDGNYVGNSIEGKIYVGTENGTIRSTGAVQDGSTMQQVTSDVKVDPTTLIVRGTGYVAELTKIDQDGTLVFQGGAATNCSGRLKPTQAQGGGETGQEQTGEGGAAQDTRSLASALEDEGGSGTGTGTDTGTGTGSGTTTEPERVRAGYLEGTGNLVLDNDGKNGALAITFADIGNGTDGFQGNIYVQGKDAALIIDDGDFDATKSTKQNTGNITISGSNVGVVARDSGVVIASGSKLTLASANDAWQEGKTVDPERSGAAGITAKYVTIVGGGTLEVISGSAVTYAMEDISDTDLAKLKKAATLDIDSAAAVGGTAVNGDKDNSTIVHINGAGEEHENPEGDLIKEYTRVYDAADALNKVSAGVVDTGDYTSGPLRMAANSNLRLINSSLNLSDSSLNLQVVTDDKVSLYLVFDEELTFHEDGTTSQIVLFTDVNGLYISHENMLGTTADEYINTGNNEVYVFKAADYFKDCWQISEETLMVYDTNAKVIYLDAVIPEPATGALAVLGLAGLAARRRRKR